MPIDNRTCFQVNLRDGLRCRHCGRGPAARETYHRGFEYHHVVPLSRGGPDSIDNLILLCRACHDAHHAGRMPIEPGPQIAPASFKCHECEAAVDPDCAEMNCGWYRCGICAARVHLFDHFGYYEPQG